MPIRSLAVAVAAALSVLTFGGDNGDRIELAADIAGAPSLVVTPMDDEEPPPPPMERRVDVEMKDHLFAPSSFEVRVGETVTFVFTNRGQAVHDAFIGDKAAQDKHEEEMRREDGKPGHAHEGGVTVPPGRTRALRYVFDKQGTLEIGCHQKGHYTSGMKAIIDVVPDSSSRAQGA
jgi:uncharacterized cupredoxin-like copper-binding protein